MRRISAGNNLTIDMDASHWRLVVNGDGSERVLVEASQGQPLRYMPTFGQRRRLPDTGLLPTLYIQRVVLGWSLKDEAWHLGLVLEPELAEARGSRWCEVAHWPDPERDLYLDIAREAGEHLAQAVARPFELIPPADGARAAAAAPAEPRPLPALPVAFDVWRVEARGDNTVEFVRSPSWARARILRIVWYLFWTVIYLVLSITTLSGKIALPKPEFLPYLGLASAGILVLITLNLIVQLIRQPNRFVVDGASGAVVALRGNSQRWRVERSEIESVYVSQVAGKKTRRGERTITHGEINLYLGNGKFKFLVENGQIALCAGEDERPVSTGVYPLTPEMTRTPLQIAGAHVARVLGVPCLYDRRVR
nr:MAG: hypothetical protein DIU68_11060 [Chloroflexota bacterium]